MEEKRYTLVQHLEELRSRVIKSVLCLFACAVFVFNFSDQIVSFLVKPVGELVFILPQEAFITKIKVVFFVSLLISSPYILYQSWRFISAGLRPGERRYALIFTPVSLLFFLAGIFFGYFLIIPIGIEFLLGFATDFLSPMITISAYVSFVIALTLAFGIIFQLPLGLIFLTKVNMVTPQQLSAKRKHALVFIFLLAALFTPPDVITQCLMAFPLVLLYELGIIFSRLAQASRKRRL